jgi:hypothetical protein
MEPDDAIGKTLLIGHVFALFLSYHYSLLLHLKQFWLLIHLADVSLHLPNGYRQDVNLKRL